MNPYAFKTEEEQNRKSIVLLLFISLVFLFLIVRIITIQIIDHEYYFRFSDKNRLRVVPEAAARGKIFDRNGKLLVGNRTTYTISIIPFEFQPDTPYVKKLAELLIIKPEFIFERYEKNLKPGYLPVRLKRHVDFSTVSKILERTGEFPGVIYENEHVRYYEYSKLASHIVGYVGEISPAELRERYREGLRGGDMVGKQGVERYFDNLLRGTDGAKFVEVTATGEVIGPVKSLGDLPAQNGADIILTIDASLQMAAESIFAWIPECSFIAIDPKNGEILAAVSQPDFDPSIFTETISDSIWEALNNPETHPMLCRWYQGLYPPASPLKIMSAAVAVNEGIANANSYMSEPCHGAMRYGDRYFMCWNRYGHKSINLLEAIAQSCDIYFYQIAIRLGLEKWHEYTTKCFFGKRTGIELPFEAAGLVPDRDYYNWRFGRRGWGKGVLLNLIIGQGEILTTPLQLCQMVCGFANKGFVWKPKIVKYIEPPLKHRIEIPSKMRGKLPFSKIAIKTSVDGMIRTVNEEWATGTGAYMEDILVAGKTGTAQNPHGLDHALFVAFAPANQPEIVVVILIEAGGSGGSYAFIARQFFNYYFHYWKPERNL